MKYLKPFLILFTMSIVASCASGYDMIQPPNQNFVSSTEKNGVTLEYKYNVLDKKYLKKENKYGIKLAAVKITNNSQQEYTFGKDLRMSYANGSQVNLIDNQSAFSRIKQGTPIYLLYLLLTPLTLETSDGDSTSSTPIGLVVGPGLAAGNMIAAGSANKNFRQEMEAYDLQGRVIKQEETVFGIIAIDSRASEALSLVLD